MMHSRLALKAAMLLVALSLVAGACGGGDDDADAEPTQAPAETAAAPTEPARSAGEQVQVDESFWHAGWKVTLGEATFSAGDEAVSIEALFENLGGDTATFDSQLVLTTATDNYADSTFDQELPQVPGGLTGDGLITFTVDDADFSFDDATLIAGRSENQQATVPLGPGGDELVSLEPREIAVAGTLTAGAVTVAVEGAELRADLPDRYSITEAGKLALTVRFSVTPQAGIQIGQGVFQDPNVALTLPDGTSVAVMDDGVSGVNELLQGKEGTTISDLSVRFEVDDPAEGAYVFIVRGAYGPGGAQVEAELPFVVVAAP
ncbi:MAG: hypothetical protein WEC75_09160 [Dehalococcoidia bacterium]